MFKIKTAWHSVRTIIHHLKQAVVKEGDPIQEGREQMLYMLVIVHFSHKIPVQCVILYIRQKLHP